MNHENLQPWPLHDIQYIYHKELKVVQVSVVNPVLKYRVKVQSLEHKNVSGVEISIIY